MTWGELLKCSVLLHPCLQHEAIDLKDFFFLIMWRMWINVWRGLFLLLYTKRTIVTLHCGDLSCSTDLTESQSHQHLGAPEAICSLLVRDEETHSQVKPRRVSSPDRINTTPSTGAGIWLLSKLLLTRLSCLAWPMRSSHRVPRGQTRPAVATCSFLGLLPSFHQMPCITQHISDPLALFPLPLYAFLYHASSPE